MPTVSMFSILLIFSSLDQIFANSSIPWPPKQDYFNQTIDHFSFASPSPTFQQRYLYEDRWYKPGGPIFFYCGNEGDIEVFWNNTGFMFELASTLNAYVIFAEHRYYGKSLPFKDSFQQPYIRFLSISQAMADYAYLINAFKVQKNLTKSQVIAFGGSYGGMLAAYMRVRYPHIIKGALAASAPVNWVAGEGNFHGFFEAVTKDFWEVDPQCPAKIKLAYEKALNASHQGAEGLRQLSNRLRLCDPITNNFELGWVLKWARNGFVMMAMMDYPYNASFMGDLPGYPVNVSCKSVLAQPDPIDALREAVGVIYNASKSLKCFDYKKQYIECADITGCGLGNDSLAWDFQSCTEMNLYDESNATQSDMFPSLPLTRKAVTDYCQAKWGVTPSFNQLSTFFGGEIWKSASNIIFSNGDLDPWMNGGILRDLSDSVVSLSLHGGAHHLDLRTPQPQDPPAAREVRQRETQIIKSWIEKPTYYF